MPWVSSPCWYGRHHACLLNGCVCDCHNTDDLKGIGPFAFKNRGS